MTHQVEANRLLEQSMEASGSAERWVTVGNSVLFSAG